MMQYGWALQFASEELRRDPGIIRAASSLDAARSGSGRFYPRRRRVLSRPFQRNAGSAPCEPGGAARGDGLHGPGPPGRLSALRVFLWKSILYGAFVWARRALNRRKRRFPARAVRLAHAGRRGDGATAAAAGRHFARGGGGRSARRRRRRRAAGGTARPVARAFYSCTPTGMHGPVCIFWGNLTPFSLQRPRPRHDADDLRIGPGPPGALKRP